MRILFIGDIYGQPGRRLVRDHLADLIESRKPDLAVANGENAAAGFGITPPLVEELLGYGLDLLTSGNHIWDKREIVPYWEQAAGDAGHPGHRLLRPANYGAALPGAGLFRGRARNGEPYAVLNLQGRVFMTPLDCPFRTADALLATLPPECRTILVDFHAEATSEKQAMGWYLDGRVTAVLGTHTHVPTADERILPQGTAFQTDVGMTGAYAGVIGSRVEDV
ncbi:MAG: TIGR00282 family metallophosphoesterase, partial [Terriglobales bacterium]